MKVKARYVARSTRYLFMFTTSIPMTVSRHSYLYVSKYGKRSAAKFSSINLYIVAYIVDVNTKKI
jgi:hypothetical protein